MQAHRKTPLHAPKSGTARIGGVAGALALEQLPRLFPWRSRASQGQRLGNPHDEGSSAGRVRDSIAAGRAVGPFSKTMRNGAPPVVSLPAIHCLRGIPGADVGHPPWKKINLKKVK